MKGNGNGAQVRAGRQSQRSCASVSPLTFDNLFDMCSMLAYAGSRSENCSTPAVEPMRACSQDNGGRNRPRVSRMPGSLASQQGGTLLRRHTRFLPGRGDRKDHRRPTGVRIQGRSTQLLVQGQPETV